MKGTLYLLLWLSSFYDKSLITKKKKKKVSYSFSMYHHDAM